MNLLARCDARWKLAAIVPAIIAIASLNHLAACAVALCIAIALLAITRLPFSWLAIRMGLIGIAAIPFLIVLPLTVEGVGWDVAGMHFSERGLVEGLALSCRCLAIGACTLILLRTAPLSQTLIAAHRLRVPGLLVMLTLLAYRYSSLLARESYLLRMALRVRGFRARASRHAYRTLGHVTGALLVRGAERSSCVADAMRCRGFDGRFRSIAEFRTAPADVIFFLLMTAVMAGIVIWDRLVLL